MLFSCKSQNDKVFVFDKSFEIINENFKIILNDTIEIGYLRNFSFNDNKIYCNYKLYETYKSNSYSFCYYKDSFGRNYIKAEKSHFNNKKIDTLNLIFCNVEETIYIDSIFNKRDSVNLDILKNF